MSFKKGYTPWNKGKREKRESVLEKLRLSHGLSKNANWNGGIRKHKIGYVEIRTPNHPNKNSDGYVYEHRLVMEKHLGRHLKPSEIVHHINHDCSDNRLENLALFPNRNAHCVFHRLLNKERRKTPSPSQ